MSLLNRSFLLIRPVTINAVFSRQISTSKPLTGLFDRYIPDKQIPKCAPDYKEFPERDLVNFPRPQIEMFVPKHRLGFIPDSWFNIFYNKTGVTGPYVLGVGLYTFLVSKEYYVITKEHAYVQAFLCGMFIMHRIFGRTISRHYAEQPNLKDDVIDTIDHTKRLKKWTINEAKDLVQRCENLTPMLYQAQRDQVFMQMEEEYRKRMLAYRTAVKKRLDYLVDMEDTKKRLQRRHIVDWVVEQVRSSMNDQVQKAVFNQCLTNLKTLSVKAQL